VHISRGSVLGQIPTNRAGKQERTLVVVADRTRQLIRRSSPRPRRMRSPRLSQPTMITTGSIENGAL
jgi:hypothetical protein